MTSPDLEQVEVLRAAYGSVYPSKDTTAAAWRVLVLSQWSIVDLPANALQMLAISVVHMAVILMVRSVELGPYTMMPLVPSVDRR